MAADAERTRLILPAPVVVSLRPQNLARKGRAFGVALESRAIPCEQTSPELHL